MHRPTFKIFHASSSFHTSILHVLTGIYSTRTLCIVVNSCSIILHPYWLFWITHQRNTVIRWFCYVLLPIQWYKWCSRVFQSRVFSPPVPGQRLNSALQIKANPPSKAGVKSQKLATLQWMQPLSKPGRHTKHVAVNSMSTFPSFWKQNESSPGHSDA